MAQVARILRRVALVSFPRNNVAPLIGRDWLLFLDQTGGAGQFVDGPGRWLSTAPYVADCEVPPEDRRRVAELSRHWIRTHREG